MESDCPCQLSLSGLTWEPEADRILLPSYGRALRTISKLVLVCGLSLSDVLKAGTQESTVPKANSPLGWVTSPDGNGPNCDSHFEEEFGMDDCNQQERWVDRDEFCLGQRPVGKMLTAHYQAGFLCWGQVVKDLINLNPHLKIMLAGAWARTTRMKSGEEYSAEGFCGFWDRWLQHGNAQRKGVTAAACALMQEISGSNARFFWNRDRRRICAEPESQSRRL